MEESLPDLTTVIDEQKETIQTLIDQLKSDDTGQQPIFNTSPTAPRPPFNFVTVGLIGAVIFLITKR